jgi:hypothetical protein
MRGVLPHLAGVHPLRVNLYCEHLAHYWVDVSKMLTVPNKFATLGCTLWEYEKRSLI